MNPLFVSFKALHFNIHLYLVQSWPHLLGFGLLPYEGIQQPHLMVALAKPPLGVLSMAPKPSAMWFISLVISWFCAIASPC